jgi:chemotaxis protein CheC
MDQISRRDLESLRKIGLEGARSAEGALQQMTGLSVELDVSRVQPLAFSDVPALLGGPEAPVVGIYLRVYGDCRANVLLALAPETALKVLSSLFPPGLQSLDQMQELERSGLTELGNVVTCAYLNALGAALRKSFVPSVPAFANDMAGAVVDLLLIEQSQRSDTALVIQTEIRCQPELTGHLLLMPDPVSLPRILEALRDPASP